MSPEERRLIREATEDEASGIAKILAITDENDLATEVEKQFGLKPRELPRDKPSLMWSYVKSKRNPRAYKYSVLVKAKGDVARIFAKVFMSVCTTKGIHNYDPDDSDGMKSERGFIEEHINGMSTYVASFYSSERPDEIKRVLGQNWKKRVPSGLIPVFKREVL